MEPRLVCVRDFEEYACQRLDRNALDYYKSGAGHEQTLRDNKEAFTRWRIRPRMLRDVSRRDLSTTVLGEKITFPVGVAPTAMQRMAHPDGEEATARASASVGTVMILSTLSTTSLEDVAQAAPEGLRWFQLYVYKDRPVTEQLVRRAEKCGYKAIVLTVDAPTFGIRLADVRNKFLLPPHLRLANFFPEDGKSYGARSSKGGSGINEYVASMFDATITWKDLAWLKSITNLPIVVKGVLTGEDAKLALEHGASAILVSNHGARQLDGVPATIDVLSEIVNAVNGCCEVYLDGGVSTGTDVFKALALGARAVFVGRPNLWGLVCKGEEGSRSVLKILQNEFDTAMTLSGCAAIRDIESSMLINQSNYCKL